MYASEPPMSTAIRRSQPLAPLLVAIFTSFGCDDAPSAVLRHSHDVLVTVQQEPLQPLTPSAQQDPARAALGAKLFFDPRLSGDGTVACASCHRPHGPNGVPQVPACASCHPADKRPGLHRLKQPTSKPGHDQCASCHIAHEAAPRDDRATCLTCHDNMRNHEPTAARCAGCHPFGDGR